MFLVLTKKMLVKRASKFSVSRTMHVAVWYMRPDTNIKNEVFPEKNMLYQEITPYMKTNCTGLLLIKAVKYVHNALMLYCYCP